MDWNINTGIVFQECGGQGEFKSITSLQYHCQRLNLLKKKREKVPSQIWNNIFSSVPF